MTRKVFSISRAPSTWDPGLDGLRGGQGVYSPSPEGLRGGQGVYTPTLEGLRGGQGGYSPILEGLKGGQYNLGFVNHENDIKKPTAEKSSKPKSPPKSESRIHRFFRKNNQRRKSESQKSDSSGTLYKKYKNKIRYTHLCVIHAKNH